MGTTHHLIAFIVTNGYYFYKFRLYPAVSKHLKRIAHTEFMLLFKSAYSPIRIFFGLLNRSVVDVFLDIGAVFIYLGFG